jgi:hypothetical protein
MCIVWFLPDCHQSEISRKNYIKVSNIKLHLKTTVEALLTHVNGRADIIKLIGGFACSAKSPLSHTSLFYCFLRPIQRSSTC